MAAPASSWKTSASTLVRLFRLFFQLIVLEGTAMAACDDGQGETRSFAVHAGENFTVLDEKRNDPSVSQAIRIDLELDIKIV